jgi:hypothetical protein
MVHVMNYELSMKNTKRYHTSTAPKKVYTQPSLKARMLAAKFWNELIALQKEASHFTEAPLKWHKKIARVTESRTRFCGK